jgi:purine-binding chemotaxis protein CheW
LSATLLPSALYQLADARGVHEAARRRAGVIDLLVFRAGGERFAVGLAAVDEVIDTGAITGFPQSPRTMLGVSEIRGALIPVYTPGPALGVEISERKKIVVARSRDGRRVGLAVDDAEGVMAFDFEMLNTSSAQGMLLGISPRGSLLAVVDIEALVAACTIDRAEEIS